KMDLLEETMEIVGLRPQHLDRFPHQLSTGQQQRVGVARAIICNPDFVILDEPTSALDLSVRGRVLELLLDLQKRFGITYIFISHDLGVVRFFCQQTAVMYLGFIVESGSTRGLFKYPAHPYTRALISAIPKINPDSRRQRIILKGEVPSPLNLPKGCPFNNRCPEAEAICIEQRPELVPVSADRHVACHHIVRGDD
ncbi:MAG: ABC transporter ATP-binding protein, partial [Deltaproteobacteria bacterium]|nr:ABC transporter ATP-binding protein [Deltaproteobacteria bacterium]